MTEKQAEKTEQVTLHVKKSVVDALPTAEQRAWFDALSPAEKRKAIQAAIEEGFDSPLSDKSIGDIVREARAET